MKIKKEVRSSLYFYSPTNTNTNRMNVKPKVIHQANQTVSSLPSHLKLLDLLHKELEKKFMIAVNTPMMPNANKKNGILYPLSGQSDACTNAEKYVGFI